MRPTLLVLLLVVLAAGGSPGRPRRRGRDGICADTARRVVAIQQGIGKADTPQKAALLLERQLKAVRDMRDRLAALGLPKGQEDIARELITDIDDALPHLETAIEAMRDGDQERATESAQRYAASSMESAREVRESGLDFEVCGSGA